MAHKGYSEQVVETVLATLRQDGWQSDGRYAASVVRGRARRGYGPLDVRQRLRMAGIDDKTSSAQDDIDWQDMLATAYKKKYGETYPEGCDEYARRGRFLQGRGFTVEQIRDFLNRLKRQLNEG